MARGILSGMIMGTVVSGLALGTLSVLTEIPGQKAPLAPEVEVPAGSEFNQSREDTQAQLPASGGALESPDVPQVEAPVPDDLSAIQSTATESAAQPQTGAAEGSLSAPEAGESAGGVAVETEAPVLPSPQAIAPEAPQGEGELSISTEPAQPLQPEISEESSAFPEVSEAPETADTTPEMPEEPASEETALLSGGTPDQPAAEQPAEEAPLVVEDAPETEPAAEAMSDEEPADMQTGEVDVTPKEPEPDPEPDAEPEPEVAQVTQPAETPEEPESTSVIGNLAPEVKTNRLATVTGTPAPEEEETPEAEAPEAAAAVAADLPPLQRYASEFENPEGKPLMSIVLIDDGTSPIGVDALAAFPYPLSFAVDAGWDGAEAAMRRYRDAGFEVLAMVNLPENASPIDAEVAMQAYFATIPEAVAVMEGTGTGLQQSREVSSQLAKILQASGHGAVLFPDGLNTAQKLIAREGVPAATVFRDFDAKGQNATVIRRFLDQAAFKAGRGEAGVIMVGRLRADTTSALLLWGLQDRASSVALAPISALLRAQ